MRTYVDSAHFTFATDVTHEGLRSTVVVHWAAVPYGVETAISVVDEFLRDRSESEEVWFVYPADLRSLHEELRSLDLWAARTTVRSDYNFRFFAVSVDGSWVEEEAATSGQAGPPIPVTPVVSTEVIEDGLRQIAADTDVLETASAGYHFARASSRRHSLRFLRASQAVARTQHAFFMGMAVLRVAPINSDAKIFVDTSGIAPAMYALKELVRRLGGGDESISIDSFGSYEGYKINLKPRPRTDWVVISSSTSGSLAKKIIKRRLAAHDRVVTLFYLAEPVLDSSLGSVVCDLTNRDAVRQESVRDARLIPHVTFSTDRDGTCPLCASGSRTVELAGDAFFPVSDGLRLRMPVRTDRPLDGQTGAKRPSNRGKEFDNSDYFEDFYGLEAIKTGREILGSASPHDTSTTIGHLLAGDDRAEHVRERLATRLAALTDKAPTVDVVLALPDQDSWKTAQFAANKLFDDPVELSDLNAFVRGREFEAPPTSVPELFAAIRQNRSILVCAGVLGSGRALLALSRQLRTLDDSIQPLYLAAVVHPETEGQQLIFENTIARRGSDSGNGFEFGWKLPREPRRPGRGDPWQREVSLLGELNGWLTRTPHEVEIDRAIARRSQQITKLTRDQLFLSASFGSHDEHIMPPINPKFALWPTDWAAHPRTLEHGVRPSQAEVLATVGHLLYESRRYSKDIDKDGSAVRRHGYALNPAIFDRFNEPQIQAAILRSTEPGELDYSADLDASRAVMDVVDHVVHHSHEEGGDAAYEFLLSIARGVRGDPSGIRVTQEALRHFLDRADSEHDFGGAYPLCRALLLYIRGK